MPVRRTKMGSAAPGWEPRIGGFSQRVFEVTLVLIDPLALMGTETFESTLAVCPCGNGSIVEIKVSYDNGWSPCDRSTEIRCPKCVKEWRVFGKFLEEIHLPDPAFQWIRDRYDIQQEVARIGRLIVDDRFPENVDFKEEHQILTKARICDLGPIVYKRRRIAGSLPSKLCGEFHRNTSWLKSNCRNSAWEADLDRLIHEEASRPPSKPKRTIRIDSLSR